MEENIALFVRDATASAQPRLQKQGDRNIISKHFNLLPERKCVSAPVSSASPFLKVAELKCLEMTHLSSLFPGGSQHR